MSNIQAGILFHTRVRVMVRHQRSISLFFRPSGTQGIAPLSLPDAVHFRNSMNFRPQLFSRRFRLLIIIPFEHAVQQESPQRHRPNAQQKHRQSIPQNFLPIYGGPRGRRVTQRAARLASLPGSPLLPLQNHHQIILHFYLKIRPRSHREGRRRLRQR